MFVRRRKISRDLAGPGAIPLWIKLLYSDFLCVLKPVYSHGPGPANVLWVCDIALFVTLAALWWESAMLNGMMLILLVPPLTIP